MAYSNKEDLLIGDVPLPTFANPNNFVNDAAAEMDSWLGRRYVTPVTLDENVPEQRAAFLTLKRINNHLATGRLILAISAGAEHNRLHAYGESLVKDALQLLRYFADYRTDPIPGAEELPTEDEKVSGPMISNAEDHSLVDTFYDVAAANPLIARPGTRPWLP